MLTYKAVSGCSYNQLVERVISNRQSSDPDKLQEGEAPPSHPHLQPC